ncbi:MAG TPA: ornithine carbamoyltransferase [Solirubrobacteraceae bacterium]|nr:ornithine carbamoyltransferase [Solirubrobacteraceae bacterium]
MRHFIDTQDCSRGELEQLLQLIGMLKAADYDGAVPQLLPRCSLGMIFEEPSTRTRVSFEVAMTKLGGHGIYLKPGEIHLGGRESLYDTAKVLSRMCDVIEARVLEHETVLELARDAEVPVINGLSDYNHPTQAIADLFTITERLPAGRRLEDCTVVFVGDRTDVCSSLMFITTQFGMNFVHAGPPAYQAPAEWVALAQANVHAAGSGSVTVTAEVEDAVAKADFLYTDVWWWFGQEQEQAQRKAAFMPRYQVNAELFARAPSHALFMHCLPATRGGEVTDEVIDHERSIVFDQAENRLHAQKGLLAWLVHPRLRQPPSAEARAFHEQRVHAFLGEVGWETEVERTEARR